MTPRDPIEEAGPERPPCQLPYPWHEQHKHPRYPSGDCVACGATCIEGCKHENAEEEREP